MNEDVRNHERGKQFVRGMMRNWLRVQRTKKRDNSKEGRAHAGKRRMDPVRKDAGKKSKEDGDSVPAREVR